MSANTGVGELEYTVSQLRDMDEQTARNTLTVNQYERWERLQDLYDDVAETEQEWAKQEETVAAVTVNADMEQLGTRVDIYGNDLLVHADPEAPAFRDAAERLDSEFGDIDGSELDSVADDRVQDLADHLLEMLDHVLVKWGETEWADLPEGQRQATLEDARSKWGVDGLMVAWGDIALAIREDREEVVGRLEKFRNPERRGTR